MWAATSWVCKILKKEKDERKYIKKEEKKSGLSRERE